jgi:predicted RNase H-like nuclease (RuvC/YqgF family)
MSFKKPYSFSLSRETINTLKEFVRKRYKTTYGNLSRTIEEAILYYIKNPPPSPEEEISILKNQLEEIKKENENLKIQLEKLMNNPKVKFFENSKEQLESIQKEISELKSKIFETESKYEPRFIKKDQAINNKDQNDNLPSFLKNNPWISILANRKKEKNVIYT